MCVIAVKEKGIAVPEEAILENCFDNNSDGAGFMYVKDDTVRIEKGFETFEELITRLDMLKFSSDDIVVYHFRIATNGGVSPGNTHPFPIAKKKKHLKSTTFETKIALAHNGRIDIKIKGDDISDTQEFVRSILFKEKEKLLSNEDLHKKILKMGGSSKFCILTPKDHKILGTGWVEDKGIKFSNASYKKRTYIQTVTTCIKCHKWPTLCTCNTVSNCQDCYKRYSECTCFEKCIICKRYGDMCTCENFTIKDVMEDCLNAIFDTLGDITSGNIVRTTINEENLGFGYVCALDDITRIAKEHLIPKHEVKDLACATCKEEVEYGFVKNSKLYCYPCNRLQSNYGGGY